MEYYEILGPGNQNVTSYFSGINLVSGALTITPAPLTVKANNHVVKYNEVPPAYTTEYIGFVPGQDETDLDSPVELLCEYRQGSLVGSYPITAQGASAVNYEITYLPGMLTVVGNDGPIVVMVDSAIKQYDGTPLTSHIYTQSGLPEGHTMEVFVSGSAKNVADFVPGNNQVHTVTIYDAANRDVTANFPNIVKVPGDLVVTPAPLSIQMDDIQIRFGNPVPEYSATCDGFVNDETEDVLTQPIVKASSYTQGSSVGAYAITGSGAVAPNYIINYRAGTLTVDPGEATIIARNMSKTLGEADPVLEADVSGMVEGNPTLRRP